MKSNSKLKLSKGKAVVSNVAYWGLNILLAIATVGLVKITGSWIPSAVLVLLSKWRVFAVRPRYYLANIKSNSVDFIVGFAFVALLYYQNSDSMLLLQSVTAFLYAVWLLFIKPRSSQFFVNLQSGVALFLGFSALVLVSYGWPSFVIVIGAFLIGYSAARHVLLVSEEEQVGLLSVGFGLVLSQVSWILFHWLVAYNVIGSSFKIPQLAIIVTLIGFMTWSVYKAYATSRDFTVRSSSNAVLSVIFSVLAILFIIVWFSSPIVSI